MRTIILLLIFNTAITLSLAIYAYSSHRSVRCAYVINQKLFNAYSGKKILEKKLGLIRRANQRTLDSLRRTGGTLPEEMFARQEQQLSEEYTASLWKRINEDLRSYGEARGFDFIYGATGDGGLMYAGEAYDVTEDAVGYLNQKYEGD